MPRRSSNQENFYFTRDKIENEFDKLNICNKFKKCINCLRAEYSEFELQRKSFYIFILNSDVKDWIKCYQGRYNRPVISPVF